MRVCVCVCMYQIFNFSNPNNSLTTWDIDMKFGKLEEQSQPFDRDYVHDN